MWDMLVVLAIAAAIVAVWDMFQRRHSILRNFPLVGHFRYGLETVGHFSAGIATQHRWLMRGLDPSSKAARLANYLVALRKDILRISRVCGHEHPALVTLDHFAIFDTNAHAKQATDVFGYSTSSIHPSAEHSALG